MKKKPLIIGCGAAVVLFILGAGIFLWPHIHEAVSDPLAAKDAPVFSHDELSIQSVDGKIYPFQIELATTPKEAAYGLMFRHSIDKQTGMLFLWDPDHPVSMWMKNTYVPLDMLFIRHDGTIVKIVTHTVPLNLTPIPSDETIHGVLEIKAGEADRLGIKTGKKVLYWAFDTAP